jgi:uncharacterized membrane protein
MTSQTIVLGIMGFLHNLFTVVWIGGLIMIVITILPAAKNSLENNKQVQQLMHAILKRHRVWVYISMVGLFLTGVLQARSATNFSGLMRFDSTYTSLVSIKLILTLIMVAIALFRSIVLGKKGENITPQQSNMSLKLVFTNALLGILILLASAFLSVV